MRGENASIACETSMPPGTSPRARGKPGSRPSGNASLRNIPACAGKTIGAPWCVEPPREHPRVRGENQPNPNHYGDPLGTSPRARGKLATQRRTATASRNIPACAGKTAQHRGTAGQYGEHPRVRGENPHHWFNLFWRIGTSPRARGKLYLTSQKNTQKRNIPACAGKTHCRYR